MHGPIRHHHRMHPRRFYHPFMVWPRLFLMGTFMYYVFGDHVYKVRRDDVTVIESETQKRSKDLTEEELIAAMRRLGIKKLEVGDDEKQRLETER